MPQVYTTSAQGKDMILSVIIVNYNVEYFLEQCLHSVYRAIGNLPVEIFVVDNNSVDGSISMVKNKFPEVILIENRKNIGFSAANNQAIHQAKGKYILLLNPDTVVEEDTFSKVVTFMENHPDAGGLGVKMLDGKGNFLPESKRGLPTPRVAFYKIFGLSGLFPKSKSFGQYHLGYLDKDKTHEIDVLSGAFMLLRKATLDKIGLLDEHFFMYGEDIDLSYRIKLGGYKNYYFPETRIIHYKGESTKKGSLNYVFVFYNAMIIFARKHFSQKNARLFSSLIHFAIYLRAFAAIIHRFIKRAAFPLLDSIFIFSGLFILKNFYEQYAFGYNDYYPFSLVKFAFPFYIMVWLTAIYYSGGYDRPIRLVKTLKGLFIGTGIILIIYSLLPESSRYSRALILLGSAWATISTLLIRVMLHFTGIKEFKLAIDDIKRIAIVGHTQECGRVHDLLLQTLVKVGFVGYVTTEQENKHTHSLGTIEQLEEIIKIHKIDELIFCAKDVPAQTIIHYMGISGIGNVDYKIAPPESLSIIGSNSIDTSGELYTLDINAINKPSNLRSKRLLDVLVSIFFSLTFPLIVWGVKDKIGFLRNFLQVISGSKTWVGYNTVFPGISVEELPELKPSVLFPSDIHASNTLNTETIRQLNLLYAKDYKTSADISIIIRGFRNLGRS